MKKLRIGFCITASHCTLNVALYKMRELKNMGHDIVPILSENVVKTDTRFFTSKDFIKKTQEICEKNVLSNIKDTEPLGPEIRCDAMIICPATGNTVSKIAQNITDTSVTTDASKLIFYYFRTINFY